MTKATVSRCQVCSVIPFLSLSPQNFTPLCADGTRSSLNKTQAWQKSFSRKLRNSGAKVNA